MPNQVSGPNTSVKIIANSFLSRKYSFGFLVQKQTCRGKFNLALIRDLCFQIKEFNPI
jgi:hypothetical protein